VIQRIVIIPAHREPETLLAVIARIPDALNADVLILDDGGNGDLHELPPRVRVLRMPNLGPGGHGNAAVVRFGLRAALELGAEEIFRVDGDGQHDPHYLTVAADTLSRGADLVIGSRFHPLSPTPTPGPTDRLLLNEAMRHLIHHLTGIGLTDVTSGFWAMRRDTVQRVIPTLTTTGYGLTLELILRTAAFAAIEEIPHPQIYAGSTKMTAKYTPEQLVHRCDRAADYLAVLTAVSNDLGLDPTRV
jgi:dolichol-phosphate mannosyltransferase